MQKIEPYKSWDFCKHIQCPINYLNKEPCRKCNVYQFHQYLKDHNQIFEEDSLLVTRLQAAEAVIELQAELITITERLESLGDTLQSAYDMDFGDTQEWEEERDRLWVRKGEIKQALQAYEGVEK